jgi:hypothetical protein
MFKSINVNNSMRIGLAGGRDGLEGLLSVVVLGQKLDEFGESVLSLSSRPF